MVWNLFSFKGAFSFGKSQTSQGIKSGLLGGWVTWVIWSFAKKLCMRCDAWAGILLWWSCQSPVAHSCSLLNPVNSFYGGMLTLNATWCRFVALLAQSFECDGHTVHMLTQQHLPAPLTHTVKSSLFTHVHSSPLSLAARLHWCHANISHYINNGWTSSGQTLIIYMTLRCYIYFWKIV